MDKKILAIDLGTQSVRTAIVTQDGQIEAVAQVSHEVDSPHDNWAQQSPVEWWMEVQQVVKELLNRSEIKTEEIAVVACSIRQRNQTVEKPSIPIRCSNPPNILGNFTTFHLPAILSNS